jgi:serine/tyrosine/threonine adenylyltransferase
MARTMSPSSHVEETSAVTATVSFRDSLQSRTVNSWVQQLDAETKEHYQKSLLQSRLPLEQTNTTKRPVFNGHYVIVAPTPLPNPRLVLYSSDVAESLLGFTSEQIHDDDDFLKFVSGDIQGIAKDGISWATPYALSIMGTRYTNNCPFGTGDGYGDGRAISIAEITGANDEDGTAFELQLKGAGTTPFHRGADGRAVFRSSIREFLASEAMHYLNVPTTRALSLVVSGTATSQRPWYREQMDSMSEADDPFKSPPRRASSLPTMDDPRLAQYSDEQKRQIILQVRRQNKADPDIMIAEPNAITCRVATSFTRIGHLDLFARRAVAFPKSPSAPYNTDSLAWKELEKMIWHACYREYRDVAYTPYIASHDIAAAATALLEHSAQNIAHMVGEWIRVGFAQYVAALGLIFVHFFSVSHAFVVSQR